MLYTNHENILVKMLHSLDSIHISQQQSNEVSSAQNSQHNNQEQIPPSIKKRYASDFTLLLTQVCLCDQTIENNAICWPTLALCSHII